MTGAARNPDLEPEPEPIPMSDPETRANKEELEQLLRRLIQRLTKQRFATTRQKQFDVGQAIALVSRTDDFPEHLIVRRALAELIRELGKRRPDVHRYVLILERAANQLVQDLEQT